jgi:hypothetical protein
VARSEHAAERPAWSWERTRAAAAAVPVAVWLVVLVVVSTVSRYLLARGIVAPFIFQDELLYSELAKSLGTTGHFALRDVPGLAGISPVYPTLISPAYAIFDGIPHAYAAVKAINALLMSLAAVPAYLIARRLVSPWHALLAAALTVAIPDLLLAGTIMTENAFYPVFLLWFWLLVRMLERPTILNQLGVLAALLLAYETRSQAVALAAALVTALVLMIAADAWVAPGPRRRALVARAGAYWLTWSLLVAGAVLFVLVEIVVRGQSVSQSLLKTYSVLGSVDYTFGGVAKWFLYHLGELDLVTGVIPFAAFLVVAAAAFDRRSSTAPLRAFAAAAVAASFWIVLVVAAFASSPYSQRLEERNDFYVMPLFLIALVIWAGALAGRLPRATAVAATVAAAATALVPVTTFLDANAITDAFGLLAIRAPQTQHSVPLDWVMPIVMLFAIAGAALFLLVPARSALALPVLVLLFLAFTNREANLLVAPAGASSRNAGVTVEENWIDEAVGDGKVAAVFTNARPPQALWQNEFFNRSVGPVYNVAGPVDGLPQQTVVPDTKSGVLLIAGATPLRAHYVLTDTSQFLRGTQIAEDAGVGMRLYRVGGVVREVGTLSGVYGDAWSGPTATFTARDCQGGRLSMRLTGDPALQPRRQAVVAASGKRVVGRVVVRPHQLNVPFSVPLRPTGGVCTVTFTVSPTAVPATVLGTGDTRELGIRFQNVVFRPS